MRELTPRQLAENDYRKASGLIQQGRQAEAIAALEQALQLDAHHAAARQTLVALLIEANRQGEAVRSLRDGLQIDAGQTGLAMILARLQLERGELKPALETLQRSLPHAADRADYQAFLAALLQRDGRHREAVEHYALALRKSPDNGVWWMGQGISLQAENRNAGSRRSLQARQGRQWPDGGVARLRRREIKQFVTLVVNSTQKFRSQLMRIGEKRVDEALLRIYEQAGIATGRMS